MKGRWTSHLYSRAVFFFFFISLLSQLEIEKRKTREKIPRRNENVFRSNIIRRNNGGGSHCKSWSLILWRSCRMGIVLKMFCFKNKRSTGILSIVTHRNGPKRYIWFCEDCKRIFLSYVGSLFAKVKRIPAECNFERRKITLSVI